MFSKENDERCQYVVVHDCGKNYFKDCLPINFHKNMKF